MFRIYGFDPADGTPAYETVLARAHPDDALEVDRALAEAFRTGTELRLLTRILVPGEPMKWVETHGHPVRNEDGVLVELIGTVIDVTERRRADLRLRRAIRARYEAVLAERSRIARELHDTILSEVAGIAMRLDAAAARTATSEVAETAPPPTMLLAALRDQAYAALANARRSVTDLRALTEGVPPLPTLLADAVRRVFADTAVDARVEHEGVPCSFPPALQDEVLRIIGEALTNARRTRSAAPWWCAAPTDRARCASGSATTDGASSPPWRANMATGVSWGCASAPQPSARGSSSRARPAAGRTCASSSRSERGPRARAPAREVLAIRRAVPPSALSRWMLAAGRPVRGVGAATCGAPLSGVACRCPFPAARRATRYVRDVAAGGSRYTFLPRRRQCRTVRLGGAAILPFVHRVERGRAGGSLRTTHAPPGGLTIRFIVLRGDVPPRAAGHRHVALHADESVEVSGASSEPLARRDYRGLSGDARRRAR
jgi:PAS domain-containing protein